MKTIKPFKFKYLPLAVAVSLAVTLTNCGGNPQSNFTVDTAHAYDASASEDNHHHGSDQEKTLFQCSMHPNVVDKEPGNCPICGMELQRVEKIVTKGISKRAPVRLTAVQKTLINIRSSVVKKEKVVLYIETPGVIEHDQSRVFTIAAWTSGRIEKLYVSEEEANVRKGERLYAVYSPILYSAMQEYIDLRKGTLNDPKLLESSRLRMKQLGLWDEQIDALDAIDKAPVTIDIPSPVSGKIMTKRVINGDYIKEGDSLYTVVDLSQLWLMADVYESELPFISKGQPIVATTHAVPNIQFNGTVSLINHHIDPKTRTARVRIVFDDMEQIMTQRMGADGNIYYEHRLLPDMWMTVRMENAIGEQWVIPRSALFDTGRRQYVFVEEEEGLFVPREIKTGPITGDFVVVIEGLEPGERVVTDGTFLLDSESQLKAATDTDEVNEKVGEQAAVSAITETERVAAIEVGKQ